MLIHHIFSLFLYIYCLQIFQRAYQKKNVSLFKLMAEIPEVFATLAVVIQIDLFFEKQHKCLRLWSV